MPAKIPIVVGQTVELLTDTPYTAGTKVNIKVTTTDGTFMTITGRGTSTQTQPAVNLNLPIGPVGQVVSVSGTNFAASTALSATFAGSSITLSGTTSTDASGAFTGATFTVPSATAGAKTVIFTAGATSAPTTFTITVVGVPTIVLTPTSGPVGTTVTVDGTGFAATSAITIRFNSVVMTTLPATVNTVAGAFTCTFAVPAVADGDYAVSATDASSGTDSATFTKTTPSLPAIYVATAGGRYAPSSEGSLTNFANMQNDDGSFATLTEEDVDTSTSIIMGASHNSDVYRTTILANNAGGQQFTATMSGEIQFVIFNGRGDSATVNVKVFITDSSGNIITNGVSNLVSCSTSQNDRTATFATNPIVTNGQTYRIMVVPDASFRLYYYSTTGGVSILDSTNSYSTPQNLDTGVTTGTIEYRRLYAGINNDNYRLDQEVQFQTSINSAYTRLEIKTGVFSGEGLSVDRWDGSSWTPIGALTANTLNTFNSVPLTGGTLELRFIDATQTSDPTLDTWQIDYVRLADP